MADPTAKLIRRLRRAAMAFNAASDALRDAGLDVDAAILCGDLAVTVSEKRQHILVPAKAAPPAIVPTMTEEVLAMTEARDPAPDPLAIPEEFRK